MTDATRAGFVALIGEPNAGKSTLLNKMVGAKVSIVTHKVQTTRARIRGVCMEGATQIVFVDTPGLFRPRRRLDRAMVAAAWGGAADADLDRAVRIDDAVAHERKQARLMCALDEEPVGQQDQTGQQNRPRTQTPPPARKDHPPHQDRRTVRGREPDCRGRCRMRRTARAGARRLWPQSRHRVPARRRRDRLRQ